MRTAPILNCIFASMYYTVGMDNLVEILKFILSDL